MIQTAHRQLARNHFALQITGMKKAIILAGSLSAASLAGPAFASSSDWFQTDGGRVRLVTTGKPTADGKLQGILDIDLKPGWKTYWREPGDAGVPPQIDITGSINIAGAELVFPAPQRHDDGYVKWAGYDYPVALPVIFTMKSPDAPAIIDADVFLGVCETICIPVKTTLTLDPASDPDNPDDAASVARALAALPGPERPDFGVKLVGREKEAVIVEATFPGDPASAELFVAGAEGYVYGTPEKTMKDGKTLFSVPALAYPARVSPGDEFHYTLVTAAGSVSGRLPDQ